jgi:hypothetical protein
MADSNQKLFSQIADLGRNINSLAESIKKNTSATESLISATDKSVKSEKESATASNKAATANPKEVKETNKDSSGIKDLTKMLSGLFGEKGPLMGKIAEVAKSKISPALVPGKQPNEPNKDLSNIAGGLKGIIKALQEGGVAKKEGKYLVGENGPEVVKLPKGAGVIPLDVKDLIAGLKTVPELADLIKDKNTIDFYGSISNTSVVDSKGKVISLNRLSADYEKKGDNAKDGETANRMTNAQDIIDSLIDYGRNNITNEVNKIDGETNSLAPKLNKSKLNNEDRMYERNQLWDEILKEVTKNGDYYNSLSISKAALLATKTVLDKGKEGAKGTGAKAEESLSGLPDSLVKESEADLKKEAADLKKSQAVVGAKEEKKEKKGLFGRKKKEKNKEGEAKEEGSSLEKKEPALEKKGSALLSKIGSGAESALFSAAGKATESLGIASPLAKKGLGSLKSAIDKKGGLGDVFSKKAESKTELEKKSATTPPTSPNAKPALVNDVKKLTPVVKKEAAKTPEAPKEIKSEASKSTSMTAPAADTKKGEDKKTEATEPNKSGLGSDKDIQDIKNALTRMAGLLEGTLSVSVLDQPFRPDSRRV